MKFLIVFVALFAMAVARPNLAEIVRQVSDVEPEKWSSDVETSDGTSIKQEGVLKNAGTDNECRCRPRILHLGDEKTGEKFTITYVADENGYQPQGAHLPVAPVA
nr:larval cuticle protein [Drosophila melanogaster]